MIELIEDGLAVYRLTRLVTTDRITQPLRDAAADRNETLGYLAGCDWCSSLWLALGVAGVSALAPRAWRPLARALASSAVTGILASYL